MSNNAPPTPGWATSSRGYPAEVSSRERSALGAHLSQCGAMRGRLHALRTGVDHLSALLAGHVVTSAMLMVMLLVGGVWLIR